MRPDAARDGAGVARRRRPAARPRRPHRARRLLPPVGRGGDRRAARLRASRKSSPPISPACCSISPPGASRDPAELAWLDPPPAPAVTEARALLVELGALDADGRDHRRGQGDRARCRCRRASRAWWSMPRGEGAGVVAGRGRRRSRRARPGRRLASISATRLERFARDRSPRGRGGAPAGADFAAAARRARGTGGRSRASRLAAGGLVACAYPERIAKARGKRGEFLHGQWPRRACSSRMKRWRASQFLAVAEIAGRAGAARILAAAPMTRAAIEGDSPRHDRDASRSVAFDRRRRRCARGERARLGALVLAEQNLCRSPATAEAAAMLAGARSPTARHRPAAVDQGTDAMARPGDVPAPRRGRDAWPDLSDKALARAPRTGSRPFIGARPVSPRSRRRISPAALQALLPWDCAPRSTSRRRPISTRRPARASPWIMRPRAARCSRSGCRNSTASNAHPALARGSVPLTLHLLSPAQRPIQITRDLPGFWRGSWAAVKAEMKGRYPRHLWPDDPSKANLQELQLLRKTKPTPGGARGNKR